MLTGRTDAEAEAAVFGHQMWRTDSLEKDFEAGKAWRQEEEWAEEDKMVR